MNSALLQQLIQQHIGGTVLRQDLIQNLWAGYGQLWRLYLVDSAYSSLILKQINLPTASPSDFSHQRKVRSYQVEQAWYSHWAGTCPPFCSVASCVAAGASETGQQYLLLQDLDGVGFTLRNSQLDWGQLRTCLDWLAHFHAYFLGVEPDGLWPQGNYWHLATRPVEWQRLSHPRLKALATELDQRLSACCWQTLIHGDAKSDNACFSADGQRVALVDFQYVGRGCGIQDVVYLFDSCLNSAQCFQYADGLLDYYLAQLQSALRCYQPQIAAAQVAQAWRDLYPVAWADFYRFVLGWAPGQVQITPYVESMLAEL